MGLRRPRRAAPIARRLRVELGNLETFPKAQLRSSAQPNDTGKEIFQRRSSGRASHQVKPAKESSHGAAPVERPIKNNRRRNLPPAQSRSSATSKRSRIASPPSVSRECLYSVIRLGGCRRIRVISSLANTASKAPLQFLPKGGGTESRVLSYSKLD